jgi:ABC-2 type transport system permease protein
MTNPPADLNREISTPPFAKGGLGGISPTWILARKEMFSLFNSPATYVVCVVYLITTGWLYVSSLFQSNQSSLQSFLGPTPLLFTILIPALTMRSFSEEFKSGTIEYLSTLPIRDTEIVLGKYLGALGWLAVLLVFTLAYPITLAIVGRPDIGTVIGAYAAILGLGAFFTAIGLWASALTRNQVVAFIMSFFICFIFFLLERIAEYLPNLIAAPLRAVSVVPHFEALARGVLDVRDLLYWASGSLFFLVACLAVLNSRRWR